MFAPPGFGWLPDLPDARDNLPHSPPVLQLLVKLRMGPDQAPESVDHREFFPQAKLQRCRNSGCSHACVGLLEYFLRRLQGELTPLSTLFSYTCCRTLLQVSGDVPTGIRATLKSLTIFGTPPAMLWPEDADACNTLPPSHLYSFAPDYRALWYVRLDGHNTSGIVTLRTVKAFLAAGFPIAFGFPVPVSTSKEAAIPFRPTFDGALGGQAVIAVGYDDAKLGSRRGAILFRNSWGEHWGEAGYGWLPYGFVEQQLASCFWTLISPDWIDAHDLSRPRMTFNETEELAAHFP